MIVGLEFGNGTIHREWRDPQAYDFCEGLTSAQWAWEFLRRNPEYQRQWQAFHHTWLELEAAYGRPPNRDFCAWKNDPRAWVPASECQESDCRVDQDKVLIECALGARWGFHKFPPDPADDDPVGQGRLSWRPLEDEPLSLCGEGSDPPGPDSSLGLVFDLSLPLKPQLEQARKQLQMESALRRRQGRLVPKRLSLLGTHWKLLLRIIDARADGALEELGVEIENLDALWREAEDMMDGGYLGILRIPS